MSSRFECSRLLNFLFIELTLTWKAGSFESSRCSVAVSPQPSFRSLKRPWQRAGSAEGRRISPSKGLKVELTLPHLAFPGSLIDGGQSVRTLALQIAPYLKNSPTEEDAAVNPDMNAFRVHTRTLDKDFEMVDLGACKYILLGGFWSTCSTAWVPTGAVLPVILAIVASLVYVELPRSAFHEREDTQ